MRTHLNTIKTNRHHFFVATVVLSAVAVFHPPDRTNKRGKEGEEKCMTCDKSRKCLPYYTLDSRQPSSMRRKRFISSPKRIPLKTAMKATSPRPIVSISGARYLAQKNEWARRLPYLDVATKCPF